MFYSTQQPNFTLTGHCNWRTPQIGGLCAAVAHWTLEPHKPALVSIPTGAGKTAIAMAAPFLLPKAPKRILIVVPSKDLRTQTVERFRSQHDLEKIGALPNILRTEVRVKKLDTRVKDWRELYYYDVVVALPNTIAARHYDIMPPKDLFDLVIIDEAHHASADTWKEILDAFEDSYSLLLTATPIRRDGKKIPGKMVYYYPMRLALSEGIYKPIEPIIIDSANEATIESADKLIAEKSAEVLNRAEHSNSTLVVRANSIVRAETLTKLYHSLGISVSSLHSRLGTKQRAQIIKALRDGSLRGVVVVGMLGEGFDLPSIRVLAYHDKHKSLPATTQLIGRLARASNEHPQPSILITVRDIDVFPALKGAVRSLYKEDSSWSTVLPGIIDTEIEQEKRNQQFANRFYSDCSEIDSRTIKPLLRAIVYQIEEDENKILDILHEMPEALQAGQQFLGGEIVLSESDLDSKMLLFIVRHIEKPRWTNDPSTQNIKYALHILAVNISSSEAKSLIFINTDNEGSHKKIKEILEIDSFASLIDPEILDEYVNGLDRHSVSAIGVRNVNTAGRGTVGYKNFMGSGVHIGLRNADTHRTALGHGNLQVTYDEDSTTNAGFAIEKGKIWWTRYEPILRFREWLDETANRIWLPEISPLGKLLPGIGRGRKSYTWPESKPLAIEMNPKTYLLSMTILVDGEHYGLHDIDLSFETPASQLADTDSLVLNVSIPSRCAEVIWTGKIDAGGHASTKQKLLLYQGYRQPKTFVELINEYSPTIFFLDGSTKIGQTVHSRVSGEAYLTYKVLSADWSGVDIEAETKETAQRKGIGISVHEGLERFLLQSPKRHQHRWILLNDGSGEIADYIVIEPLDTGEIHMSLWHAKPAGGQAPSVRIDDIEKVVSQAIKSRRWFKNRNLWRTIAERLEQRASPFAYLIPGSNDISLLQQRLGINRSPDNTSSWVDSQPVVRGNICIAQPGLSEQQLSSPTNQRQATASNGITSLLTVLQDTANVEGLETTVLCSS